MAKHITGLSGLTGANEGDRLRPSFLHFHLSTYVTRYGLLTLYTRSIKLSFPLDVEHLTATIKFQPLGSRRENKSVIDRMILWLNAISSDFLQAENVKMQAVIRRLHVDACEAGDVFSHSARAHERLPVPLQSVVCLTTLRLGLGLALGGRMGVGSLPNAQLDMLSCQEHRSKNVSVL